MALSNPVIIKSWCYAVKNGSFSLFKTGILTRPPAKTIWRVHLCSFGEFLNKDVRQFCVSDPRVCWVKDSTQHVQGRPGIILSPWQRQEPTMHRLVPAARHMAEPSLRNTPAKCLRTRFHASVCCCLCHRGWKGVSWLVSLCIYIFVLTLKFSVISERETRWKNEEDWLICQT